MLDNRPTFLFVMRVLAIFRRTMMSLFGRMRQHRFICPLVIVGFLGNLVLLIFYFSSNGKQIDTENLIDANGIPLFLHERLENDHHRNSLKKEHKDMVRMKLTLRYNGDLKDHSHQEFIDLPNADTQRHLRAQDIDGNLRNRGSHKSRRATPSIPEDVSDNVKDAIRRNKNQVIPLKLLQMSTPKVPVVGLVPQQIDETPDDDTRGVRFLDRGEEMSHDELIQGPRANGIMDLGDPAKIKCLVSPPSVCRGTWEIFLLIAVCSDVRRVELREAIRRTWASNLSNQRERSSIVFVLGRPQKENKDLARRVTKEAEKYGDIILLDIDDKYSSLTLKTMAMLYWVQRHCSNTKYILKSDDDVFINVPNLLKELKVIDASGTLRFMLGNVIDGAHPSMDRKDKWYMPVGQFKGKSYPTYLSGSAYVLPYSLLEPIILESQLVDPFWLEDIYVTGMLAANTKTALVHNSKFEFKKRKLGPCRFKHLISAHEMTPEDLIYIWREMHKANLKCRKNNGRSQSILDYDLHP